MALRNYAWPIDNSLLKARLPQSPVTPLAKPHAKHTVLTEIQKQISGLNMKKATCTTCDRSLPLSSFPKIPEDSGCDHGRETCRRCWHQWLDIEVETKGADQIACAQCTNTLGQSEVRALATPAVYQKFLDMAFTATLAAQPDFRGCIASGCKSGQIHSEGDIFRCVVCEFKMCVHCNIEWHEGETCQEAQERPKIQEEQEKESAKALKKFAKLCPGCGKKLEKDGGCDHMRCKCGHKFCWRCLVDYQRIRTEGNSAHKNTCIHFRPNPNRPAY